MTAGSAAARSVLHLCTVSESLQYIAPSVHRLALEGWEMHVASSAGPELDALRPAGVATHVLPMSRAIHPLIDTVSFSRLVRLMRRIRPHVVHAHTPKAGLLGMLAARLTSVRHRVYQIHGLRYETTEGPRKKLLQGAERTACAVADHIICVSSSVRERLLADRIAPPEKITVFGRGSASGVDHQFYSPPRWIDAGEELRRELGIAQGAPCVGFAGRLAEDKGLSVLEQAWSTVAERVPGAQLILAGDFDEVSPAVIGELQRRSNVHFIGRRSDMERFYALIDVFVLPSYREGLPLVVLEASAMEVPVVGTRVTGVVNAVQDGKTGLVVAPREASELSRALLRLLESASLRSDFGEAGRAFVVDRFDQAALLDATARWYAQFDHSPA